MINHKKYEDLIKWHHAIELFDYNSTVDWAIELIEKGIETESVLIIASFSKPVDRYEIKSYVSSALKELNIEEKYGAYSIVANAHYYLESILAKSQVRKSLSSLYKLSLSSNQFELVVFDMLDHAWSCLEEIGHSPYYREATIENIESIIMEQAQLWIDKYVDGKEGIILTKGI